MIRENFTQPRPGPARRSILAVVERPAELVITPAPAPDTARQPRTEGLQPQRLPFVVAHRGASGVLPEHTLPAFARAISLGADAIEVDVVPTADGRLIARHEAELVHTTDASLHPRLLALAHQTGADVSDPAALCAHHLSLRDVTRLRARQRSSARPLDHNDRFMIPTLAQVIGLARRSQTAAGRIPAVHIELKDSARHAHLGLPLEREVIKELAAHGWNRADAPVLIQSFEAYSLLLLSGRTSVPLLQLARLDEDGLAACTDRGLDAIATYAVGLGVSRSLLAQAGDTLVARAHRRGLVIHAYTFADDDPSEADPHTAYLSALSVGVDGLITDFPDSAVRARDEWAAKGSRAS